MLSWEFNNKYSLRNHLYPVWLSLPAFVLKWTGLDTNFLVVNSMYFQHCLLWTFGDVYFFFLVQTLIGKQCAILAQVVSFANDDVFRFVSRVSSNGVEGSLVIAGMYYYLKIKPQLFDKNLSLMTLMITLCFITRSSSLVPWIPLALLKIA